MSWLFEDPWTIIAFGAFVELLLAVALFQTRRGALLWAMGGVLAAALLGLALEWLVVTETEEVENTIYAAAAAVEEGDVDKVLAFIAPGASQLRNEVSLRMGQFDVSEAHVHSMEVKLQGVRTRRAVISFTAKISGQATSAADVAISKMVLRFEVQLRKDGDRWLITGYEFGRRF